MPPAPTIESFTVAIDIALNINETTLRSYLANYNDPVSADAIEKVIAASVIRPDETPESQGYRIVSSRAERQTARSHYLLRVDAVITDPAKVTREDVNCYRAIWQDANWRPESYGEALFEIMVASNSTPSPDVAGYEIVDYGYPIDRSASFTPPRPTAG